jgi:hypothetical protein
VLSSRMQRASETLIGARRLGWTAAG